MLSSVLILFNLFILIKSNTFHWQGNIDDQLQWQRSYSSSSSSAVCIDIPSNLTLCYGISYNKMRLPNLLNHETLTEVTQQSTSWLPLKQLNCHPDTQLFLCSLFSPVCLDQPIPPCRSLCQSVQTSCEHEMLKYGYPWPKIVQCNQFPIDNDMCIMAQHAPKHQHHHHNANQPKIRPTKKRKHQNERKKNQKKRKEELRNEDQINNHRDKIMETVKVPSSHLHQKLEAKIHHQEHHHQQLNQHQNQHKHHQNQEQLNQQNKQQEQQQQQNQQLNQQLNAQQQQETATQKVDVKNNNKDKQLYNEIIEKWCDSQWILKARIMLPKNQVSTSNQNTIKIRSFKLMQGTIGHHQLPLIINNSNSNLNLDGHQGKKRYFLMGKKLNDNSYSLTYGMIWPNKSPQLRKALKIIKNGRVNCNKQSVTLQPITDQSQVISLMTSQTASQTIQTQTNVSLTTNPTTVSLNTVSLNTVNLNTVSITPSTIGTINSGTEKTDVKPKMNRERKHRRKQQQNN